MRTIDESSAQHAAAPERTPAREPGVIRLVHAADGEAVYILYDERRRKVGRFIMDLELAGEATDAMLVKWLGEVANAEPAPSPFPPLRVVR